MRTEELSYGGYFWRPNHPGKKLTGTLMISDGGIVRLEVIGNFDDRLEHFNRLDSIPRLIGVIESKGQVTLDHCDYTCKSGILGSVGRSKLSAQSAYLGAAFDDGEEVRFRSFQFSVEGIDAWHSIRGITTAYDPNTKFGSISYEHPKAIELWSNNDFSLSLSFGHHGPALGNPVSASITQLSYFVLRARTPRLLDEYSSIAYKVVNLMSFAVDRIVAIRDVYVGVAVEDEPNKTTRHRKDMFPQLFFESIFYQEKPPKIDQHRLLFGFDRIAANPQQAFDKWMVAHEQLLPAMGLYFSAQTDRHPFISSRFLSLAQALEVYHRRTSPDARIPDAEFCALREKFIEVTPEKHRPLVREVTNHWNSPTLRTRMERLLSRFAKYFGNEEARIALAGQIVRTRNYYTHFDPTSKVKDTEGEDIWRLCTRMNALFQLCLLSELGFSDDTIDAIVKDNWAIKQKLAWGPRESDGVENRTRPVSRTGQPDGATS